MADREYFSLAWMTVDGAPGTGAVTLGAAYDGNHTFADVGMEIGDRFTYHIGDDDGWERGEGVFNGDTVTREEVFETSAGTLDKLSFSADATIYNEGMPAIPAGEQGDPGASRVAWREYINRKAERKRQQEADDAAYQAQQKRDEFEGMITRMKKEGIDLQALDREIAGDRAQSDAEDEDDIAMMLLQDM